MNTLAQVFDGWGGYQTSLVHAIASLTSSQLSWKPDGDRRSIGETIRHISFGRVTWFARMKGPGTEAVCSRVPEWHVDADGNRHAIEESVPADDAGILVEWLDLSWSMIQQSLNTWSVDELAVSYTHRFHGVEYLISRQWTIWRIMAHDIHHGGQIAMMLALQGIEALELRTLGGHVVEPPRVTVHPGE